MDGLAARVDRKQGDIISPLFPKDPLATQNLGVESIFAALFLSSEPAFERLWSLQIREGKGAGAWPWFSLSLDPWETEASPYYGAALAAIAVGKMPASYRNRPAVKDRVGALAGYLTREYAGQPLHNRLMALWASAISKSERKLLVEEIWLKQEADGGWTSASLGPWGAHKDAPPQAGSNAYATSFVAYVLRQTGISNSDPKFRRALGWLRARQNKTTGAWEAVSMNKVFPAESNQIRFMDDAATGFAVMSLLGGSK
jgi:squalene-hopene/tetraprenyl-beta-curcumene cyclase